MLLWLLLGVAMVLLGGCNGVAMVVASLLLGGCYGVAMWLLGGYYGVARCCYVVALVLQLVAGWLLWRC